MEVQVATKSYIERLDKDIAAVRADVKELAKGQIEIREGLAEIKGMLSFAKPVMMAIIILIASVFVRYVIKDIVSFFS